MLLLPLVELDRFQARQSGQSQPVRLAASFPRLLSVWWDWTVVARSVAPRFVSGRYFVNMTVPVLSKACPPPRASRRIVPVWLCAHFATTQMIDRLSVLCFATQCGESIQPSFLRLKAQFAHDSVGSSSATYRTPLRVYSFSFGSVITHRLSLLRR